ncbi:hypothetical protein niasHT_033585 [Heterodera trifolii]|uniref:Uncharacterized protein n=1 Tax=Heterodera trifolii TaxID=157864 RepID=A0ABD2HWW0_9BILA
MSANSQHNQQQRADDQQVQCGRGASNARHNEHQQPADDQQVQCVRGASNARHNEQQQPADDQQVQGGRGFQTFTINYRPVNECHNLRAPFIDNMGAFGLQPHVFRANRFPVNSGFNFHRGFGGYFQRGFVGNQRGFGAEFHRDGGTVQQFTSAYGGFGWDRQQQQPFIGGGFHLPSKMLHQPILQQEFPSNAFCEDGTTSYEFLNSCAISFGQILPPIRMTVLHVDYRQNQMTQTGPLSVSNVLLVNREGAQLQCSGWTEKAVVLSELELGETYTFINCKSQSVRPGFPSDVWYRIGLNYMSSIMPYVHQQTNDQTVQNGNTTKLAPSANVEDTTPREFVVASDTTNTQAQQQQSHGSVPNVMDVIRASDVSQQRANNNNNNKNRHHPYQRSARNDRGGNDDDLDPRPGPSNAVIVLEGDGDEHHDLTHQPPPPLPRRSPRNEPIEQVRVVLPPPPRSPPPGPYPKRKIARLISKYITQFNVSSNEKPKLSGVPLFKAEVKWNANVQGRNRMECRCLSQRQVEYQCPRPKSNGVPLFKAEVKWNANVQGRNQMECRCSKPKSSGMPMFKAEIKWSAVVQSRSQVECQCSRPKSNGVPMFKVEITLFKAEHKWSTNVQDLNQMECQCSKPKSRNQRECHYNQNAEIKWSANVQSRSQVEFQCSRPKSNGVPMFKVEIKWSANV